MIISCVIVDGKIIAKSDGDAYVTIRSDNGNVYLFDEYFNDLIHEQSLLDRIQKRNIISYKRILV